MEPPAPFPLNIPLLAGPRIVGIVLNWYLHGLLTVQYILYLMYSQKDRRALKLIVHFLYFLDSAQSILTLADTFFWFVYGFSSPAKLLQFNMASFDVPAIDGLIALVVQTMYCWRIWKLGHWKFVPALALFISLLGSTCGFVSGIRGIIEGGASPGLAHRITIMIWLFGSAVADVIIAISMACILLKTKRDAIDLRSSTARRLMHLLTLILETNAITAAVAIETVAVFMIPSLAPPRSFLYEPGGYSLGKLYSNCFMILLNQRHKYGAADKDEVTVEFGSLPNFATISDSTPGDRTSSIRSPTNTRRHRLLGQPMVSKPRNLHRESKDHHLPAMKFAKSSWATDNPSQEHDPVS